MQTYHSVTQFVSDAVQVRDYNWYVFSAFNLYRLVLSIILLGLFYLDANSPIIGADHPELFQWAVAAYAALVLISMLASLLRYPSLNVQSHIQALIDIAAFSVFSYTSGGLGSNITILLVIAVAASGILLPFVSALIFALLASLATLCNWIASLWKPLTIVTSQYGFNIFDNPGPAIDYLANQPEDLGRLGILIMAFFIAVITTYALAERARRNELLAQQRTQEILELVQLNQAIVQHLQSGIIVVDAYARIRLMNNTASELLDHRSFVPDTPLSEVSQILSQRLASWLSGSILSPKPFRQDAHLPDITPTFSSLETDQETFTLILLEDSSQASQRLQQIKLAALGRLTASIAHEIRNPLTSVSHAAQLLSESTTTQTSDRRLGQIIHDNARRANRIITNVLDMSRRDIAKPEEIGLNAWLNELKEEFVRSYEGDAPPHIVVLVQPPDLNVLFDPGHLRQVVWNLLSNGCKHGTSPNQSPHLRVLVKRENPRAAPILDVIDSGPGISEANIERVFEPFFTTKPQGTGLGLFISREICEANRAQLQHIPSADGACFRITFANVYKKDLKIEWRQETL